MPIKTISAHLDHTFSLRHNNRSIIANNVDSSRIDNNYYAVMSGHTVNGTYFASIEEIYEKIFEPSWREYQARQRPARRYDGTYLDYIRGKEKQPINSEKIKNTRIHSAYEIVCQIGNQSDTDYCQHRDDFKKASKIMMDTIDHIKSLPYVITVTDKELNNPDWQPPDNCLILLNAVTHNDETCPGNHITIIPCCKSDRGAARQALLKRTFSALGYKSDYVDNCDLDGQPIIKYGKNGQPIKDSEGNMKNKKAPKNVGAIDWIREEISNYLEREMKERYNWDRSDGIEKRKHLDHLGVLDFKIKSRKEELEELDSFIFTRQNEATNFQNKILDAMSQASDAYERTMLLNTKELWTEYRNVSSEFWGWYNIEIQKVREEIARAQKNKNRDDLLKLKVQHYKELYLKSNNLIYLIAAVINRIFRNFKYKKYSQELKELIQCQRQLGSAAMKFSSASYTAREEIKNKNLNQTFICNLKDLEKSLKSDYSNVPEISRAYEMLEK